MFSKELTDENIIDTKSAQNLGESDAKSQENKKIFVTFLILSDI